MATLTTALGPIDVELVTPSNSENTVAAWVPSDPGGLVLSTGRSVKVSGFAELLPGGWTHDRKGRDGIVQTQPLTDEERGEVDTAVLASLADLTARGRKLRRLVKKDAHLGRAYALQRLADEARAKAAKDDE